MYAKEKVLLPPFILDVNCESVGRYMIKRYISRSGLFGCMPAEAPQPDEMQGPKELVKKLRKARVTP